MRADFWNIPASNGEPAIFVIRDADGPLVIGEYGPRAMTLPELSRWVRFVEDAQRKGLN